MPIVIGNIHRCRAQLVKVYPLTDVLICKFSFSAGNDTKLHNGDYLASIL